MEDGDGREWPVDLGFAGDIEDETLDFQVSRIGGQPIEVCNKKFEDSQTVCDTCKKGMRLLLQLYCPDDKPNAFHKVIYVFACANARCHTKGWTKALKCLRSQLAEGQETNKKEYDVKAPNGSWPTYEIQCEREPDEPTPGESSLIEHKFGPSAIPDKLEEYEDIGVGDEVFLEFQKRIERDQDQILRYLRTTKGGSTQYRDPTLWVSKEGQLDPQAVPGCSCGANRIEEDKDSLDWGILNVYTCDDSCDTANGGYAEELVWRQEISN